MKKISIILSALLILSAFTFTHTDHYVANCKVSTLTWHAQKIKAKHFGNISLKNGVVQINHGKLISASFIFDMNTITNNDIKNKKYRDILLKDLNSKKFFDIDNYPEATFKLIKATPIDENKFDVLGQLEIKGNLGTVNFPLEIIYDKDGKVRVEGSCTFNRTKFGITYNSGSYFDDLGDKLIDDKVVLDFNIVLEK